MADETALIDVTRPLTAAQQEFAALSDDVTGIGRLVRAAYGPAISHHIAAQTLPADQHTDFPNSKTTFDIEAQRASADQLAALQGGDAAIALAWMLSALSCRAATSKHNSNTAAADRALEQLAAAFTARDGWSSPTPHATRTAVCTHYMNIANAADPAGAGAVRVITGIEGFWKRRAPLTGADFMLLAAFSGKPTLWKLHRNTIRHATRPTSTGVMSSQNDPGNFNRAALERLHETITAAAPFNAATIQIAATLAADNPDTRTVTELLDVAALITDPEQSSNQGVPVCRGCCGCVG